MKKSLYAAASALALTGLSAPAFAGGLTQPIIEPAPVAAAPAPVIVAPGRDWTGVYGGAQLGYGWATFENDGLGIDEDADGVVGGLHVGFDYDFGQFVLGAEAAFNAADLSVGDAELDQMTRLGLRAGFDAGDALIYATGGWANARINSGAPGTDRSTNDGYFGGVGVDYFLADNWTVGGQILMHRFDDVDGLDSDVKMTTAEARVSFRF
ncbi:outer membrane protein [Halodurantibacterium flavum]|uniref:Outer membrane protein n=1 Tax=Halodurantibacterium flavum TaxID=1382802 RepID=A0ABW4SAL2_9RHOB